MRSCRKKNERHHGGLLRKRYAKQARLDEGLEETESITRPYSVGKTLIDLPAALERVTHVHKEIRKLDDDVADGIPEDLLDEKLEEAEAFSDKFVTAATKLSYNIKDLVSETISNASQLSNHRLSITSQNSANRIAEVWWQPSKLATILESVWVGN